MEMLLNKGDTEIKMSKNRQQKMIFLKVFLGMKVTDNVRNELIQRRDHLFDNPFYSRHYRLTNQIYPWQVAPQQSLFPFLFDKTKVIIFFQKLAEKKINFPKKSLPLPNKCKVIIGLIQKCKVIIGLIQKCKDFLGRDTLYFVPLCWKSQHRGTESTKYHREIATQKWICLLVNDTPQKICLDNE